MDWNHLIEDARPLAGAIGSAAGRPRQTMLKRAVSAAYYAMFHALCASNADTLCQNVAGGGETGEDTDLSCTGPRSRKTTVDTIQRQFAAWNPNLLSVVHSTARSASPSRL